MQTTPAGWHHALLHPHSFTLFPDQWWNYIYSVSRLQTLFLEAGITAWFKAVQAAHANKSWNSNAYREFYNSWSVCNEQEFAKLFNNKDYALLQEKVLILQTALARYCEDQLQLFLAPYPVITRTEQHRLYAKPGSEAEQEAVLTQNAAYSG